jgi:hypothetical protein
LGIEEDNAVSFKLYPNPIERGNDLVITAPLVEGNWNYFILDITGRMVKSGSLNGSNRINSGAFAPGMYHIYLNNGASYSKAKKFIVR